MAFHHHNLYGPYSPLPARRGPICPPPPPPPTIILPRAAASLRGTPPPGATPAPRLSPIPALGGVAALAQFGSRCRAFSIPREATASSFLILDDWPPPGPPTADAPVATTAAEGCSIPREGSGVGGGQTSGSEASGRSRSIAKDPRPRSNLSIAQMLWLLASQTRGSKLWARASCCCRSRPLTRSARSLTCRVCFVPGS